MNQLECRHGREARACGDCFSSRVLKAQAAREHDREQFRQGVEAWQKRIRKAAKRIRDLRAKAASDKDYIAQVEKREKELRGLLSSVSQTYCNYGCPNISPDGLHSEVCRKVQAASKEC